MTRPALSFEFSPLEEVGAIPPAVLAFAGFNPAFVTVTFGTGETPRENTGPLAQSILEEVQLPTAAHLTLVNLTKAQVMAYGEDFWQRGLRRLIVLNGDRPEDYKEPDYTQGLHYRSTQELVADLRRAHPTLDLSVAVDPENLFVKGDPVLAAVRNFKEKVAAGADRGIAQVCFDLHTYDRLFEEADKAGIKKPIIPGLIPVLGGGTLDFVKKMKVPIPDWLRARFAGLDKTRAAEEGVQLLTEQINYLKKLNVGQIHFFTVNRFKSILRALAASGFSLSVELAVARDEVGQGSTGAALQPSLPLGRHNGAVSYPQILG